MIDDPILTILSIQFVFDWVASTIVAVTWCYLFKLVAPEYSDTLLGWGIYTLLMILLMPLLRMILLRQLQQSETEFEKKQSDSVRAKAVQGWRLMLSATCGTAVGTSIVGLMPLFLPEWSNLQLPGSIGFVFVLGITLVYVFWQARLERRLHIGDFPTDGYIATLLSIMLMSTWSVLGFLWNIVWTRVLQKIRGEEPEPYNSAFSSGVKKMRTFLDMMYGRPDTICESMQDLFVKAAITLILSLSLLLILPDPPPLGEDSTFALYFRRRGLLAVQMVLLSLTAYTVTDVGFYFGTNYVARLTGSQAIGLAVASLYAVLITGLAIWIGIKYRFQTKTDLGRWLRQMGCLFTCYAWWYCYQEFLFQVQSFYLDEVDLADWVHIFLRIIIAVIFTGFITLVFSHGIVELTQYRMSLVNVKVQDGDIDELTGLLGNDKFASSSLRYFAACSGLFIASRASDDDKKEWQGAGYGAFDENGAALGGGFEAAGEL